MGQTNFSGPVAVGTKQFETPTAAKTLTSRDYGKTFTIVTTGYTYTLPSLDAGASFRFVAQTAFTTNFILVPADTDLITGSLDVNSSRVNVTAADQINMVGGSSTIGDWVEIWCDGVNWYVDGFGEQSGAITATG